MGDENKENDQQGDVLMKHQIPRTIIESNLWSFMLVSKEN